MRIGFWLRRFVAVYLLALAVIAGGQLLRGQPPEQALTHGLLWALISAAIYIAAFAYRARRGCATCPSGR